MSTPSKVKTPSTRQQSGIFSRAGHTLRIVLRNRWLYAMMLPGILFFIIFKYGPMWGLLVAFKDYNPFLGVAGSPWAGMKHFARFLSSPECGRLFRNTLLLACYNLIFYFPLPILLALMLNEVKNRRFKRVVQSFIYIPHFISWVVVVGICYIFLNSQEGLLNPLLSAIGVAKHNLLTSRAAFRPMIIAQIMWKEAGWGTIIFLAALSGVDIELYEAAYIDGASRGQRLWYITLPSISSTICVMLILRLGRFMDTGFDQIFNMINSLNREVGEVFDTYIYEMGLRQGLLSYSTAVGMFKSVIGLTLVYLSDKIAKRLGEEGVY